MAQIHLKAKLQAYSKAPFYGDYIRPPEEALKLLGEPYDPRIVYGIKDGKWVDISADDDGDETIESLAEKVNRINENIKCRLDYKETRLIFTNGDGTDFYYYLPEALVDNKTIGKNEHNDLSVLDTPDGQSIKVVDEQYNGNIFSGVDRKISGKLRAEALYVKGDSEESYEYITGKTIADDLTTIKKDITDLQNLVEGRGGFLNPIDFGNLSTLSDREIYDELSAEAKRQLGTDSILDQTKIKNLYDGRIWAYVAESDKWVDEGADTIVNANNEGVLGAVTGSNLKFKISIDPDPITGRPSGIMSVNNLEDEFSQVVYKKDAISDTIDGDTVVRRTSTGSVKVAQSQDDNDAINQGQLNALITALQVGIGENDINQMFNKAFPKESN